MRQDIVPTLSALWLAGIAGEARTVWEPILPHDPAANVTLQHCIHSAFLRLWAGDDPVGIASQ